METSVENQENYLGKSGNYCENDGVTLRDRQASGTRAEGTGRSHSKPERGHQEVLFRLGTGFNKLIDVRD